MVISKNPFWLGIIIAIVTIAISVFFGGSFLTTILAAGVVGYEYGKQHKKIFSQKDCALTSVVFGVSNFAMMFTSKGLAQVQVALSAFSDTSDAMKYVSLFLIAFCIPFALAYLGLISGSRIGAPKVISK